MAPKQQRGSKKSTKESSSSQKAEWGQWSEWTWSSDRHKWYSCRIDSLGKSSILIDNHSKLTQTFEGNPEYEYREAAAPTSEPYSSDSVRSEYANEIDRSRTLDTQVRIQCGCLEIAVVRRTGQKDTCRRGANEVMAFKSRLR